MTDEDANVLCHVYEKYKNCRGECYSVILAAIARENPYLIDSGIVEIVPKPVVSSNNGRGLFAAEASPKTATIKDWEMFGDFVRILLEL